ncbi:MAG: bifunctional nuclease family protein [Verrucomicrobiales bacterium]
MPQPVVQVEVKAVVPANGGCAIFLGNDDKVFVIYIDQMVGMAVMMAMHGVPKERPLTHDLIVSILSAYDARLERVVVNDFNDNIFFARLILVAANELHQRKIMEIDARPSDCLALALRLKAPIYVSQKVWEHVADESALLRAMQDRSQRRARDDDPDDPALGT